MGYQVSLKSDSLACGSLLWGTAWVSPRLGVKVNVYNSYTGARRDSEWSFREW